MSLASPRAKQPPRKRPAKRPAPPVAALAAAAWAEADTALAEALVECSRALEANSAEIRAEALDLLAQALARAARRRGLTRFGAVGAAEDFDPMRHELSSVGKAPRRVRVQEQGVARGDEILIKARVGALRGARK